MHNLRIASTVAVFLFAAAALFAQAAAAPSASTAANPASDDSNITTIRGCLQGERGSYIVVEKSGMVFALKGVGNKLDSHLNHDVQVKGQMLPGSIKTGTRPEKGGSNPSDTLHSVDGTTFLVNNPLTDVQNLAKHCKSAD